METPLASCIMPTGGRAEFALHALRLFQRQDYAPRELIVVDDGDDNLEARLPAEPRLRYLHLPSPAPTYVKRNLACALAQGEYVVQWDDDDWYGPERLSVQLAPLRAGAAMSAMADYLILDLERWACWARDARVAERMGRQGIFFGSLAFRRADWDRVGGYPPQPVGSEVGLMRAIAEQGGQLVPVDASGHFICVRHGGNTWQFCPGQHIDPRGWHLLDAPPLPDVDRAFYTEHSRAYQLASGRWPPIHRPVPASAAARASNASRPLVSCIMPTFNRPHFVPLAIHYFLCQDYPARELIIVDDGDARVAGLIPNDPRIHYQALDRRHTIGAKRNLACALARGEYIVHWDDDDWHAPWRLSYQVGVLEQARAELCTLSRAYQYEPARQQAWLYSRPLTLRRPRDGPSLSYCRRLWQRNPFPDRMPGEDTAFVRAAAGAPAVIAPDYRCLVSMIHGANSSHKALAGPRWLPRPFAELAAMLGPDMRFY
jgi:glycosyltransferase involved in cell wall biosynthesis